ncbi:hypothetical protein FDP41_011296 [Naegleria fowleri]|uniref:Uncharacterized protein n=1 Tax=Naegleria fowleri TaxID=5763 RepID=A0A6A5C3P8_NAEFO|nr:uncharacterized protein FDP41_011296 [Naegleria fowleri]KAF0982366.1 hypothetical protein FDP41_011296 [Naegleria fowleri]CAG4709847.1 unnamed protein product [Naegleria fowleri]
MKLVPLRKSDFIQHLKNQQITATTCTCKPTKNDIGILLEFNEEEEGRELAISPQKLSEIINENTNSISKRNIIGLASSLSFSIHDHAIPFGMWKWEYPNSGRTLFVTLPGDGNEIWNWLDKFPEQKLSKL